MTASVLQVHPFLDPHLSENRPDIVRYLYSQYLSVQQGGEAYNEFLNRLLHPVGDERLLEANLATSAYYMNEAMHYVHSLLDMIDPEARAPVTPRDEVVACSDAGELLHMIFNASDPRTVFEARRKLYLTKLFFDVDYSWEVQRGPQHKEFYESILRDEIFRHVNEHRTVEMCYALGPDGRVIDYGEGEPGPGQECWTFDVQQVEMLREGRPIRLNIYYYVCRFKREVRPYQYRSGQDRYQFGLSEMFPGMQKRRGASIVSKMIRKGEADPRAIQDLIGAMFIVENQSELEDLKEILFDRFGGYFRVKNVVDTATNPHDHERLNPHASTDYRVYKAEMDVLYNPPNDPQPMPYFFTVEVQLYTLENYLRTLHSSSYANHQSLKRRQFLDGLVPYLFPSAIYGEDVVRRLVESSDPVHDRSTIATAKARGTLAGPAMMGAPVKPGAGWVK